MRLSKERDVERIMGDLLRLGVILAALVVALGGAVYLIRHGSEPPQYHAFRGEPSDLRTVRGIVSDALAIRGRGIIQLGVLLLLATPVARVVFSVFVFAVQRDWTYVLITVTVLAVLTHSLLGKHP